MSKPFFYDKHTPEQHIETAVDYINHISSVVLESLSKIKAAKLGSEDTKIHSIPFANYMGKFLSNIATYADNSYYINAETLQMNSKSSYYSSNTKRNVEDTVVLAKEHADLLYAKSTAEHEANLPLIESNKRIQAAIISFMQGFGFNKSTYVDEVVRRKTVSVEKTSGWYSDVLTKIRTMDSYTAATNSYKEILRRIEEYAKTEKQKEYALKQKNEAEAKEKLGISIKAGLCVKYNLDYTTDWKDIESHILSLDKYLNLAFAMECTRNDWNDGFYLVENALNEFTSTSDVDSAIEDEITQLCYGDEHDGRIFRDAEYNYGYLYGLADADVHKDFSIVKEYVNRW